MTEFKENLKSRKSEYLVNYKPNSLAHQLPTIYLLLML